MARELAEARASQARMTMRIVGLRKSNEQLVAEVVRLGVDDPTHFLPPPASMYLAASTLPPIPRLPVAWHPGPGPTAPIERPQYTGDLGIDILEMSDYMHDLADARDLAATMIRHAVKTRGEDAPLVRDLRRAAKGIRESHKRAATCVQYFTKTILNRGGPELCVKGLVLQEGAVWNRAARLCRPAQLLANMCAKDHELRPKGCAPSLAAADATRMRPMRSTCAQ